MASFVRSTLLRTCPTKTGRLRRGDRGDGRFLFQQQHVGLARLGQAVRHGAADGPAADDDNLSLLAVSASHGEHANASQSAIMSID